MLYNNEKLSQYEKRHSVFLSVQALICILGIVCNVLAISVFERKQLKKHSYSFYWRLKAYFDSWLLLCIFLHWVKHFLNIDIDLTSSYLCRFHEYQPFVACTVARCIEALITLDRYFLIVYQDRFKVLKKRWFQISLISLILVYSILVNIRLPLYYRLDEVSTTNGTVKICHISNREWNINMTYFIINIVFINFVVNPILNFRIVYYIFAARNPGRLSQSAIIDRKFTISAIGLNVNSLLVKLPLFILIFFSAFLSFFKGKTEFIFAICFCIGLIEKADVFFVNILVNSVFREEFLSMIGIGNNKTRIDNEIFMSLSVTSRRNFPSSVEIANLDSSRLFIKEDEKDTNNNIL